MSIQTHRSLSTIPCAPRSPQPNPGRYGFVIFVIALDDIVIAVAVVVYKCTN